MRTIIEFKDGTAVAVPDVAPTIDPEGWTLSCMDEGCGVRAITPGVYDVELDDVRRVVFETGR